MHHVVAQPGLIGSWVHFLETAWPPWRPLLIIKSWIEVPGRALRFIRHYRPEVGTLIIGHSHWPGLWKKGGLQIINTGSAMCGFTPRAVSIENGKITVVKLTKKNGTFQLAAPISESS